MVEVLGPVVVASAAVKTPATVSPAMKTAAVRSPGMKSGTVRPPAAAAAASKNGLAREGAEQEHYQRNCGNELPHES
jgi:hypothetical protein